MLTICTTVKNRSRVQIDGRELRLFPNCVESIARASTAATDVELVVADWQSDDWPLAEWLADAAHPIPVHIRTLRGTFSRGRGLNVAARAAHGEYLFFMDSDALMSESVFQRGLHVVQQGKAYFPVLFSFMDPGHRTGYWRHSGFGHCMLTKQAFEMVGGWPEYRSWGREDDDFLARVAELWPIVREPVEGFCHQWHPNDLDFKNQYGEETDAIRNVRARAEQDKLEERVRERLRKILPHGACYILVDEDRTDIKDGVQCRPVPFLERNGQYWGPPNDDTQAIYELERLRQDGARFIVFPWVASWWLDHYTALAEHLQNTARCVEKDELLVVYDMQRPLAATSAERAR